MNGRQIGALCFLLIVVACTPQGGDDIPLEAVREQDQMIDGNNAGEIEIIDNEEVKGTQDDFRDTNKGELLGTVGGYSGEIIAGDLSVYLRFTQTDYEKALASDKTIFLFYYANWCPTCQAEHPETLAAFNELDNEDIVGFLVHFRDDEATEEEVEMAKKYGVSVQHTKLIIQNREVVDRFIGSWNKEQYFEKFAEVSA